MPEDLKRAIIEAIAASGDDNYKRLLLLLLRVEEMFIERIDMLADQMTVPANVHAEDHAWVKTARDAQGSVKAAGWKIAVSLTEKGALVAAGAIATKFFGG